MGETDASTGKAGPLPGASDRHSAGMEPPRIPNLIILLPKPLAPSLEKIPAMNPIPPLLPGDSRAPSSPAISAQSDLRRGYRKLSILTVAALTAGLSIGLTACQDSHSSKAEPIVIDPPIPDQWDAMFWDLGIWQD